MSKPTGKIQSKLVYLFIIVGIIIYSNSLDVPFYFDDQDNIANPALRMESLSVDSVLEAGLYGTLKSRPLSNISFSLNYLLGEYNVIGYHALNIIIHISGAIILYLLFQSTLALPVNRRKYDNFPFLALFTALIWLAHPIATQSVTYIVQRMNSMAAMFFVLALLLYVKGRTQQIEGNLGKRAIKNWMWFAGCGLSGLFAVGSKEIAATLPLIIVLYEWYFFQDLKWTWVRKNIYWFIGAATTLGVMAYIYTNGHPIQRVFQSCGGRDFTNLERVLTQFRVVVHYIGLILYPKPERLTFDYDFSLSTSLIDPITTLISLVALVCLVVVAVLLARREKLLSFCIVWFVVNLVMESSVICLEIIFEHRTYLPSMFFLLFFTALISRSIKNNTLIASLFILVTCLFGFWTYERNEIWKDPVIFWTDSLKKNPKKIRIYNNLGNAHYSKGNYEQAEKYYSKAIDMRPTFYEPHYNMGILYYARGDYPTSAEYFMKSVQLRPLSASARNNLGHILHEVNQPQSAIREFRHALHISPQHFTANKNLGIVLLQLGRAQEALFFLNNASIKKPESTEILQDIGKAYLIVGKKDDAESVYRRILAIDENSASAHYNLALLLAGTASNDEIYHHYREAVRLNPTYVPAVYNFANYLYRHGRLGEAEKHYKRVIELSPEMAGAFNNYGLIMVNKKQFKKAESYFSKALRIMPGNNQFRKNLMQVRSELEKENQN